STANAGPVFANNEVAASLVNVFVRKNFNVQGTGPSQWGSPDLTFDTPFVFLPNQNVVWRLMLYSNSNTASSSYVNDCYSDWRFGVASPYSGCKHPLGTQPATHNSTYRSPGQQWDLNGYSYVPNLALTGAVMIGASNTAWGAIPLPFDMTALGAP